MTADGFALKVFLLHLLTLPFIALILYTLRPGGAEKSYALNFKYCPFLLPGKWKDKSYFILWTHRLARLWLVFFAALYLGGWIYLLKGG